MVNWQDSIWFFDIDDTLIDTAGDSRSATQGVEDVFTLHCGTDKAKRVANEVNAIFELLLAGYRVKNNDWSPVLGGKTAFDQLLSQIETAQADVIEKFGKAKLWSREVFIKLACDRVGVPVTPEIIHEAADGFWIKLTQVVHVLPGVVDLFQTIVKHSRPIYLVTSSDARLQMDEAGQFHYDPKYSEGLKRQRIELLREKGIVFNALSIGDPQDKPDVGFFQKGVETAQAEYGKSFDLKNAIMIGDSFAGDLQTPKEKMGFGLVVLFQKDRSTTVQEDEREIVTGDLSEVLSYIQE